MTAIETALTQAAIEATRALILEMFPELDAMNEQELSAVLAQLHVVQMSQTCPYSTKSLHPSNTFVMLDLDQTFRYGIEHFMHVRSLRDGVPCVRFFDLFETINGRYEPIRKAREAEEEQARKEAARRRNLIDEVMVLVATLKRLNEVEGLAMTPDAFDQTIYKIAGKDGISDEALLLYFEDRASRQPADAAPVAQTEAVSQAAEVDPTATVEVVAQTSNEAATAADPAPEAEASVDVTLPVIQMPATVALTPEAPMEHTDAQPVPVVQTEMAEDTVLV